jgi:Beta-lactamase
MPGVAVEAHHRNRDHDARGEARRGIRAETLVKHSTLAEAFTRATVREGRTTYGLGWNVNDDVHGKRVWHQGNTAGFRAFIERRLRDRITVIMLTNGGNTNRMAINDRIQKILMA